MFYTIYKTTNIINGKYYIGKHQTKDLQDGYMGSGKLLKAAISKYGKENFHKEILHVVQTEKEMDLLEKILVVPDIEISYNLCNGGKGGWGFINREKLNNTTYKGHLIGKTIKELHRKNKAYHIKAISKLKIGIMNDKFNFTGKKHSLESKDKISKGAEKRLGNKNGSFGTCWITNGQVNKKIKKDELDNWLELGYYKGRI